MKNDECGTPCTIWDLTYLLIALLLLNKFRIFFHRNLDGSPSRRAPLLIRVKFILLRFCNFPIRLLLAYDEPSNCQFVLLGQKSVLVGYYGLIRCATDVSNSFVYVWSLILLIRVLVSSLKVSLVRFTLKYRLTNAASWIYKSLWAWRIGEQMSREVKDSSHSFSTHSRTFRLYVAGITSESRYVGKSIIDLFTSERVTNLHILTPNNSRFYTSCIHD